MVSAVCLARISGEQNAISKGTSFNLSAASAACAPAFLPQSAVLGPDLDFKKARAVFEARYLEAKLHECGGNITRLAETIGLERSYLHRKLKGYGISSE